MQSSKRRSLKYLTSIALLPLAASVRAAQQQKIRIGVVVPTLDAQFWNNYIDFMKQGARQLGVDLIVLNADNKPDRMVSSLEDLTAQKVDGIIFTPYWSTAVAGLTLARNAGIPVILTDSYPDFSPQTPRFPNYIAFTGRATKRPAIRWRSNCFPQCRPAPVERR
ncbi:substrate-binding domain-containing protein [Paraburkholderia rhizosphaerae]|nr:substrate-binding domain-containing protein [Paraburkholderia rhizosphaerae]